MRKPDLPNYLTTVVIDGRRMSLFSDGTLLPVIAGGDGSGDGGSGGDGGGGTGTPPAPPTPPPPPSGVTFTPEQQAHLDRIAAREKDEGRRAAEKAIADQLGCTPDEAKAIIERQRDADKERMTEAERKEAEATEKLADAQRKDAEATRRLRDANVRTALVTAGVKGDRLVQAAKLVEVSDDADEAAITTAVETFKTATPEWFGTSTTPPPPPSSVPGGTGGNGGGQAPTGPSALAAGREAARKLHGVPEPKSA